MVGRFKYGYTLRLRQIGKMLPDLIRAYQIIEIM